MVTIDLNAEYKWDKTWVVQLTDNKVNYDEDELIFAVYCNSYEDAMKEIADIESKYDVFEEDLNINLIERIERFSDWR